MDKLGAEVHVKVTYRDYLQFPDDGQRYEVIDGEAFVTPAPNVPHQEIVARLVFLLTTHVRAHKLGRVLFSPCDVVFEQSTVVQPDVLFVSNERRDIVERSRIAGAPDLLVEVLSPSTATRDRSVKLQTYARHGVAHYWILDPDRGELEEYVLSSERAYRLVSKLGGPVPFAPRLFPGLTLDLAHVWSD